MVRVASNEATAQSAVSRISNLTMPRGRMINLGQSTIPSMNAGVEVSNQLLANLEKLVNEVLTQADKFPKLAQVMAQRDQQQTFNAGDELW